MLKRFQAGTVCQCYAKYIEIKRTDFLDFEKPQKRDNDRVDDTNTLAAKEKACWGLSERWEIARQNPGNFCR
jgi:hypothetical protein